jgi:hypothetical protein
MASYRQMADYSDIIRRLWAGERPATTERSRGSAGVASAYPGVPTSSRDTASVLSSAAAVSSVLATVAALRTRPCERPSVSPNRVGVSQRADV